MSVATEFYLEPAEGLAGVFAAPLAAPTLRAVPDSAPVARPPAIRRARSTGRASAAGSVTVLRRAGEADLAAPLRLTRRGVIVVAMLVLALGVAVLALAARSSAGAGPAPSSPTVHQVTVRAGDTLWSIASRVAPQRDPRAEVADLQRANSLSSVDLVPGQSLRVP